MKRENEHLHPSYPPHINTSFTGKMCWEEENTCTKGDHFLHPDAGMDELLAVLGYKVKSSDMAQVAQKLEQLEEAMCSVPEEGLSQLATDSVHYNPSDISNWIGNMLSEFTPPNTSTGFIDQIVYPPHQIDHLNTANKRLKPTLLNSVEEASTSTSARQIVVFDSQEDGVRLVHTLMACAEAIHQSNLQIAETLVNQIGLLAASQAGAMRKVAIYFAEALARRIYNLNPSDFINPTFTDLLQIHFYETSPYLKFAHFTANQAIIEAFSGKNKVHVIDFAINQGMQWPPLMQALALRPGGPPAFRLTGIGPPSPDGLDRLHEVGIRLAQVAETIGVEFEFRGFVANSLADLDASMLDLKPSETESIAVNSVFELHRSLARPGAVEKVLRFVKEIKPVIVTVAEQESNHNGSIFIDRFNESLHYYSTLFDSLEGLADTQDKVMSEVYLGHQICNVVACEGLDRIERHEPLDQWRERFGSAGFESVHIGSNAYKQASMLLDLFSSVEGYKVEENAGCLLLGWHSRTLIATSAWRVGSGYGRVNNV